MKAEKIPNTEAHIKREAAHQPPEYVTEDPDSLTPEDLEEGMRLLRERGAITQAAEREDIEAVRETTVERLTENGYFVLHGIIDNDESIGSDSSMAMKTGRNPCQAFSRKLLQALNVLPWRKDEAEFSCSVVAPDRMRTFAPVGLFAVSGQVQEYSQTDIASFVLPETQQRTFGSHGQVDFKRRWQSDGTETGHYDTQGLSAETQERLKRGDKLTAPDPVRIKEALQKGLDIEHRDAALSYNEAIVANPSFSAVFYELSSEDRERYRPQDAELYEAITKLGVPLYFHNNGVYRKGVPAAVMAEADDRYIYVTDEALRSGGFVHGDADTRQTVFRAPEGPTKPYRMRVIMADEEVDPSEIATLAPYEPTDTAKRWANELAMQDFNRQMREAGSTNFQTQRPREDYETQRQAVDNCREFLADLAKKTQELQRLLSDQADAVTIREELYEVQDIVSTLAYNIRSLPEHSQVSQRFTREGIVSIEQVLRGSELIAATWKAYILKMNESSKDLLLLQYPELNDLTEGLNQDIFEKQSPMNLLRKLNSIRINFAESLAEKDGLSEYDFEVNKFTVAEVAEWLQTDDVKKVA